MLITFKNATCWGEMRNAQGAPIHLASEVITGVYLNEPTEVGVHLLERFESMLIIKCDSQEAAVKEMARIVDEINGKPPEDPDETHALVVSGGQEAIGTVGSYVFPFTSEQAAIDYGAELIRKSKMFSRRDSLSEDMKRMISEMSLFQEKDGAIWDERASDPLHWLELKSNAEIVAHYQKFLAMHQQFHVYQITYGIAEDGGEP